MACNAIAVLKARITTDAYAALSGKDRLSQQAREALRVWLSQQTGEAAGMVYATPTSILYSVGQGRVLLAPSGITIETPRWSSGKPLDTAALEALVAKLGIAVQKERIVAAIKARAYVQTDEAMPTGHRVLTVSL